VEVVFGKDEAKRMITAHSPEVHTHVLGLCIFLTCLYFLWGQSLELMEVMYCVLLLVDGLKLMFSTHVTLICNHFFECRLSSDTPPKGAVQR
jgi:hypothetical protein